MSPRMVLCLLIGAGWLSPPAAADEFLPSRGGAALDQPNGARTVGPLRGGAAYPLLKKGGPGMAWCKLQLPEGPGWARCSTGLLRADGEAPQRPQPPQQAQQQQQQPQRPPQRQAPQQAPGFDYFLLSLSWSPSFCAGGAGRSPEQCAVGKRLGFVVHGLWPQGEGGGGPMSCAVPGQLDDAVVGTMLDLMPSRKLIRHEWEKHGSCSGLGPEGYFDKTRAAFGAVRIPEELRQPTEPISATLAQIEALFLAANPGLTGEMLAVQCKGYVSEVRVCLDRDLRPRRCGRRVVDACPGKAIFPPVR